jgi:hypothetical protein
VERRDRSLHTIVHLGEVDTATWGDYADAIARWEHALGRPAPAPTMTSTKGNPQLAPTFVEWMMGLPPGHVTDVPGITRNEALKALGNGVVPQQAEAALRFLLDALARNRAGHPRRRPPPAPRRQQRRPRGDVAAVLRAAVVPGRRRALRGADRGSSRRRPSSWRRCSR